MEILLIVGVIIVIGGGALLASHLNAQRRKQLTAKYQDIQIVEALIAKKIWQGETKEMLLDSLGQPDAVDTKVLKSKEKEVLKFGLIGGNRYRIRVTIENGLVVGWDENSTPVAKPTPASKSFFDEPKPRRRKNAGLDDF